MAAVTKFHGLGGLKNRSLFSHHSGGSKAQLRAGLASSWLRGGRFLAVSSVHAPVVCLSKFLPFIIPVKLTRAHSNGPFYLNTSLKALSPNTFIFGGAGSWGFNIGVGGTQFSPQQRHCFLLPQSLGMCSDTMGRGRGLHAKMLTVWATVLHKEKMLYLKCQEQPLRETLLINAQASSVCPHTASFHVSHLSCTFRKSPQTFRKSPQTCLIFFFFFCTFLS